MKILSTRDVHRSKLQKKTTNRKDKKHHLPCTRTHFGLMKLFSEIISFNPCLIQFNTNIIHLIKCKTKCVFWHCACYKTRNQYQHLVMLNQLSAYTLNNIYLYIRFHSISYRWYSEVLSVGTRVLKEMISFKF